jgi:hypothetical protein
MCLRIDLKKTREFENKNYKQDYHVFFKEFEVDTESNLYSPYQGFVVVFNTQDWITTDDVLHIVPRTRIMRGAFHGYRTNRSPFAQVIIIPIIVLNVDVIALGVDSEVCFLKYRITSQTWKRIVKGDFGTGR